MSDIFETDIDDESENLSSLEDTDIDEATSENLVFDYPLYHYIYRNDSLSHDGRFLPKRLDDRIKLYKQLNEFRSLLLTILK